MRVDDRAAQIAKEVGPTPEQATEVSGIEAGAKPSNVIDLFAHSRRKAQEDNSAA